MRDCRRIRKHLWLALALPLWGASCAPRGKPGGGEPPASVDKAADAEVTTNVMPGDAAASARTPEPGLSLPTCPSGEFCTDAAAARKIAAEPGVKSERGCVISTRGVPSPAPEGVPRSGNVVGTYNDDSTQKVRAAKNQADVCCYSWFEPCPGGRPLYAEEGARVAPLRPGEEWARGPVATPAAQRASHAARARALPGPLREQVAAAWLADAQAEHASIASFARATSELMAVAAPPDLLAAHVLAAADEVRHAQRCFALAARYAGAPSAPGPLPAAAPRAGGLARLARDTFLEGCVGETIASLAVARALAGCLDAEVAAVLRGIGDDEEHHAALAWRTLSWALAQGGAPVADALRAAWQELRAQEAARAASVEVDRADDAALLAAHGRLDRGSERRVRADALECIIAPTLTALLAQAPERS